MNESSLEKFIKRESEELRKNREKNDYRNLEPFRTKRILEANLQLIKETPLSSKEKMERRLPTVPEKWIQSKND